MISISPEDSFGLVLRLRKIDFLYDVGRKFYDFCRNGQWGERSDGCKHIN